MSPGWIRRTQGRSVRRIRRRLAVPLLGLTVLFLASATPARGDTATQLPFSNKPVWLAVDPAGQHVFVSGGPGTSSIVVLDYDGNIVNTITGEGGASQMAVDTATHTLYVALHDDTAISEINTQTLTETSRFSTAPYADPRSLVIANGKLWFSCNDGGGACLASAKLDGSAMTSVAVQGLAGEGETTALSAAGNLLALGTLGSDPSTATVYDISHVPPTLVSSGGGDCENMEAMTLDPAGANLLLACGFPYYVAAFSTSDLLTSFEYPTSNYPQAVTVSADGNYVAGGINTGTGSGNDLFVYPVDNTTPVRTWSIGTSNVLPYSLAFSPDASRLFAISDSGTGLDFYAVDQPTVSMAETVTALTPSQNQIYAGQQDMLTAHVTGTSSGTVHLYGTPEGGSKTLLATDSVGAGGNVAFTLSPTVTTTYSAVLDAGPGYASSISPNIPVTVMPPVVSLSTPQQSIYAGQQATLTADVSGPSTGTVQLYATPNGGSKTLVATGPLAAGEATFTVSPTGTTTYSAVLEAGPGYPSASSPDLVVTVMPPPPAPTNLTPPTFSGFPQVGDQLTADPGTWSNDPTSYAYAWFSCDPNTLSCDYIPNATDKTYLVQDADVGLYIGVEVVASNAGGDSDPADSDAYGPVLPAVPENLTVPQISGVAQVGKTLTLNPGTWSGSPTSYTYQWFSCDAGLNTCNEIPGATGTTYVVSTGDVGRRLVAGVIATNDGGDSDVAVSNVTDPALPAPPAPPANELAPTISGTPQQGRTLTAAPGTWSNSPAGYGYQWERCSSTGTSCANIAGATATTYTAVAADVGSTLIVQVVAANAGGSSAPVVSAPTSLVLGPNCHVPNVVGLKLAKAKPSIRAANCSVGRITKKKAKAAKRGRVLSQTPKHGQTLPNGAKVNLRVGTR